MDDARQRRHVGPHAGQQPRDIVRVGDIGGDSPDVSAVLFAQRFDPLCGRIAGLAPAGQHHMLGAVGGQVRGDLQPDGTEPAGHQIGCVIA